jgi:hypothetical protein
MQDLETQLEMVQRLQSLAPPEDTSLFANTPVVTLGDVVQREEFEQLSRAVN